MNIHMSTNLPQLPVQSEQSVYICFTSLLPAAYNIVGRHTTEVVQHPLAGALPQWMRKSVSSWNCILLVTQSGGGDVLYYIYCIVLFVLYCAVFYCMGFHCIIVFLVYCMVFYYVLLYFSIECCIVFYNALLYYIVLHCNILCSILLDFVVMDYMVMCCIVACFI